LLHELVRRDIFQMILIKVSNNHLPQETFDHIVQYDNEGYQIPLPSLRKAEAGSVLWRSFRRSRLRDWYTGSCECSPSCCNRNRAESDLRRKFDELKQLTQHFELKVLEAKGLYPGTFHDTLFDPQEGRDVFIAASLHKVLPPVLKVLYKLLSKIVGRVRLELILGSVRRYHGALPESVVLNQVGVPSSSSSLFRRGTITLALKEAQAIMRERLVLLCDYHLMRWQVFLRSNPRAPLFFHFFCDALYRAGVTNRRIDVRSQDKDAQEEYILMKGEATSSNIKRWFRSIRFQFLPL